MGCASASMISVPESKVNDKLNISFNLRKQGLFSAARREEEKMEKFIPYAKRSKKEQRKLDRAKRQTWGQLKPVTRRAESAKIYNRKRIRKEEL